MLVVRNWKTRLYFRKLQKNTRNPLEVPFLQAIEVEELRQHHQDMDQDLILKALLNQQPILPN